MSPVRGHCAKLCSNGDGVTLICLSPLLHTPARYTTCIVVPIGTASILNLPHLAHSHGSTSRRSSIDLPTKRSIDPRRDTHSSCLIPSNPLLVTRSREELESLNLDSH
ncbi:hypothetical protein ACS0PU_002877 [Formica fusca]